MMFPLIKPVALAEIYNSCQNCMHQIDRIWCLRTARQLRLPREETCAVLDRVSVVHWNSLSLKTVSVDSADPGDALELHKEDWVSVDDITTFKCIQ